MYADVRGSYVYYQIPYNSQGTLFCQHRSNGDSDFKDFNRHPTYHTEYAECSKWTKGHPEYTIKLDLNEKTYITNENDAIANGKYPGSSIDEDLSAFFRDF